MALRVAAIFGASVGQHPADDDALLFEEWQHAVVEHLGGGNRRPAVIELGEADLRVGVDHGLLVNPADPFEGADIESVLRHAVTRAFALEFAMGFFVQPGLLQSHHLRFGQNGAVLRHFGFQCFQALFHVLEVMTLPDAAHAERRDRQAALA